MYSSKSLLLHYIVIKMKNQIHRCDALRMNSYHLQVIRDYSYAVDRDM